MRRHSPRGTQGGTISTPEGTHNDALTVEHRRNVAICLLEFAVAKTDIECPTAPVNELTAELYAAIEDVGLNIPVATVGAIAADLVARRD